MIAEDSALLREGLRALLTDEGVVVDAAVGDGDELLALLGRSARPDVVLVDVRMPPTHTDEGIRAAVEIRRRWPTVAVLVLSQHVESEPARELVTGEGAGVGYLLKDRVMRVSELLDALHRVARGEVVVDPEVVRQLFAGSRRADPLERLTPRESDVLGLMAEGRTNAGIGAVLHLSLSAVEKHGNAIFTKLGLDASDGYSRRVLAVLQYLQG
ncbi:response regulator transcription factor [Isoptericola cucumis]|uniref:DNA-binding response regulator n=1 Tax=Isoptericola cucumis TaxID=1776856 RepID=A0ABQ2B749_9MICO|nr:response regulator transcription factor [Isoptericola cucumis]GGI09667.1 DNA-binding response regulator [Isoptericola cucumis]